MTQSSKRQATFERYNDDLHNTPTSGPNSRPATTQMPPQSGDQITGERLAQALIEVLYEDVTLDPSSSDTPERLTTIAEATELVLGDPEEAEQVYRRALRLKRDLSQGYESLRRLHRALGNWRTVSQLLDQERREVSSEPRQAVLALMGIILDRTRDEAQPPLDVDGIFDTLNQRDPLWTLKILLDATRALGSSKIDEALRLRRLLIPTGTPTPGDDWDPEIHVDLPSLQSSESILSDPAQTIPPKDPTELRMFQEWTWSEANLRWCLLGDLTTACSLLLQVFKSGRRDPELLDALADLLTEQKNWDQLRDVYQCAIEEHIATPVEFEALASLEEFRYRNTSKAISTLQEGIDRFPQSTILTRRLVDVLATGGDVQGLIDALGQQLTVVRSSQERADILWRLGRLFDEETGMTSAALEVLHEAIEELPYHGPTLRALGRIYTRQNNGFGVADLYERELACSEKLPQSWRRHYKLAEIYEFRLSSTAAAMRHYTAVLEEKPEYRPAYDALIRLYTHDEQWDDLVRFLLELAARTLTAQRRASHYQRAAHLCEKHLDNDLLLREILQNLMEEQDVIPQTYETLADLYQRQNLWEELLQLREEQAAQSEDAHDQATLWWTCGMICEERLKDTRRAETFYRHSLGVQPDFVPALGALGRIFLADQRFDELLDMSEAELDVLEHPRLRARRMEAMAEIYERELGRRTSAIEMYERIVQVCPQELSALRRLESLYREQGRWEQVADLVEIQASMDKDPINSADRWYHLGEIRERRLQDATGALDAYTRALDSHITHTHALRGALRVSSGQDDELLVLLSSVARDCEEPDTRRLALRTLARSAEQRSQNPSAGIEYRQEAVAANPNDREARDVLEASYAAEENMPGLVGVWSTAGRSLDEGLLGLLCACAGINASALLSAFLDRWNSSLDGALMHPERRAIWHGALGEFSRGGLDALGDEERLNTETRWANLPTSLRRRVAIASLASAKSGANRLLSLLTRPGRPDVSLQRLKAFAGDALVEQIQAVQVEVRLLKSPGLKVARLLDLSALDLSMQRDYYARAVAEEAFESPIQEELYQQLEAAGELDLLRKALEAHLCVDGLSPSRRSYLASWLGQTIESIGGSASDALEAYRTSFQAGRDQTDSLLHMARLAEDLDNTTDAIRYLESFLTLSTDTPKRLDAGVRLSALYLAQCPSREEQERNQEYDPYAGPTQYDGGPFGQKALDLLTRLREEGRGSEREPELISLLAHAHMNVGSPYQSSALFQEVLAFSSDIPPERIHDALALVDLYRNAQRDPKSAERLLWILFDAYPNRDDIRTTLLEVVSLTGSLDIACERIEHTARHAPPNVLNAADRRSMLEIVADLYTHKLRRYKEAAELWGELAGGSKDPSQVRRMRAYQAATLCRVPGEEARCHDLMLSLHDEDPFDLSVYEGLDSLYETLEIHARRRMVQQVRSLLDSNYTKPSGTALRRKTRPSRSFDDSMLFQHLLPEGLQNGVLNVLQALEPLAVKVWGDQLPTLDSLGAKRWKGEEFEQVRFFAEHAAWTFNVPRIKLFLSDSGPGRPQVFNAGSLSMWFHRGMFEGVGAEVGRFLGGYAAGMCWSRLSNLSHLDGRDLWHLLEAVMVRQTGSGLSQVTDPRSMELVEVIGGAFNRSLRRRVADAAAPRLDMLRDAHCEAWPAMIHQLGIRSGLVLSGQVSGAFQALLKARQWRGHLQDQQTQNYIRKLPEVADTLRFALSEDYFMLRYGCGLDTRPPRVG